MEAISVLKKILHRLKFNDITNWTRDSNIRAFYFYVEGAHFKFHWPSWVQFLCFHLKLDHDHFLPHDFYFVVNWHPTIWCYRGELPAELLSKSSLNKTNTNCSSQPAIIRTHRIVIIHENKTLHAFICNKITSSLTSSQASNFSLSPPPPPTWPPSPNFFVSFSYSSWPYTFIDPLTMLQFEAHAFCDKLHQYINTNLKDRLFVSVHFFAFDLGACTSIDLTFISPL